MILWFFTSRKGILTVLAVSMTLALSLGIIVAAAQGKMDWGSAALMISGTVFSSALVMFKTIDAIASEDNDRRESQRQARARASADTIPPPPPKEG